MDGAALENAARLIAARNVNDRIASVEIDYLRESDRLVVHYRVLGEPSDTEVDLCELTCAELLAEFPEIDRAETVCTGIAAEQRPTAFQAFSRT